MAKVRVLDDVLVNRIAAGEVVERPASVVKELVENSLDAGATRIEVDLEGGGKRAIRVRDDGEGMDRDDALLALERHATSKLCQAQDLEQIGTLGFRGEALPSIASVARFLLRTSAGAGTGTEIEVRGGRIVAVREVESARGTVIEVASLFFNTPARRKFLKSDSTELAHATRHLIRLALARPDVAFRLVHDGRVIVAGEPAADRRRRIADLYGADLLADLVPVAREGDAMRLEGFVTRPASARGGKQAQHIFVNGRAVQDRMLLRALFDAFTNTLARDRTPAAFLFLNLDSAQVDVNVHPQKTEVRFARPAEVHALVRAGVEAALGRRGAIPTHGDLRPALAAYPEASLPTYGPATRGAADSRAADLRPRALDLREPAAPERAAPAPSFAERPESTPRPGPGPSPTTQPTERASFAAPLLQPIDPSGHVRALVQYDDSYIVAADEEGLVVVDQHAAHERVLFERYLGEASANGVEVQRLLFPRMIELGPQEAILVEEEAPELQRLGFLVEPFGPGTVRLDGIPSVAAGVDAETLFREILGEARRIRSVAAGVDELRRALVTSASCQAAIKIHHRLTDDGMQRLLDDLMRADNPTTCPHGRPILFRLTREEIERTFRRR